jgi:hypothetical protein
VATTFPFPDPVRSFLEETEPYRHMTPEERGRELDRLCRSAPLLLEMHPDPRRVLDARDPLPLSTREWMRKWGLEPGPDR